MKSTIKGRLFREELGFTLPEMMVTIVIMIVVLFALYNIFDMSIRVFSYGNNKVEAVENARLGLERMEREIRAAYPVSKATKNNELLSNWTANSISFGNELSPSDHVIDAAAERITYQAISDGTLRRKVGTGAGSGEPVVEFVDYTDSNNTGLEFTYCKSGDAVSNDDCGDGFDEVTPGSGNESDIDTVRIELNVRVEGGDQDGIQTLTTDVDLRNGA